MRGLIGLAICIAMISGCNPSGGMPVYIGAENGGVFELAMTETTPAYFTSRDGNVFLIEQRLPIPFRQPTQAEMDSWGNTTLDTTPFGTVPFIMRHDIEIEVDWTLSNLDPMENGPTLATVVINGFNQFNEYVPGIRIVDDELVIDFAQNERVVEISPGQRLSWTVRMEPMDEVAVDLATVVNGAPNANEVVYFQNQSQHDARSAAYVPAIVPGLLGVRMGIRVQSDSDTAPRLVLETALRVTDRRGVLAAVGDMNPWMPPTPATFTPMPPATM